jgi:hypothetical protein
VNGAGDGCDGAVDAVVAGSTSAEVVAGSDAAASDATCGTGNNAAGTPCVVNTAADECEVPDGDCSFVPAVAAVPPTDVAAVPPANVTATTCAFTPASCAGTGPAASSCAVNAGATGCDGAVAAVLAGSTTAEACAAVEGSQTEAKGGQKAKEVRTKIKTEGLNQGQIEEAKLRCAGVVEETFTEVSRYNAGSDGLTKQMTTIVSVLQRKATDINNAKWAIAACGLGAAMAISFGFIFVMSFCATLIIWATLWACWLGFFILTLIFAHSAGLLDEWMKTIEDETGWDVYSTPAVNATLTKGVDDFLSKVSFGQGGAADGEQGGSVPSLVLFKALSYVFLVLFLVYPCFLLALRKQIRLAIELVREAGHTIMRMKFILFYPLFTYFWMCAAFTIGCRHARHRMAGH